MADPAAGRAVGEPRTAFVLAGGAALGAMQAGMVHALYERGIAPDLLIGTSAGALNAAFLASRPATVATAQELAAVWRGLRRSDILPLRPATLISALAGRRDHLIPDLGLRRLAARHLQFERLEQAAIPLHLVAFDLLGVPVAIAENPTNPPLACGDVVLFGLGQRVLRRAAGSASAVTWAEVCSPSWTYRPRLPRCRCRDLAWSSGAVRPSAARCWRAEWRSWWSVQPCSCGSWAAAACLNRYSARG